MGYDSASISLVSDLPFDGLQITTQGSRDSFIRQPSRPARSGAGGECGKRQRQRE